MEGGENVTISEEKVSNEYSVATYRALLEEKEKLLIEKEKRIQDKEEMIEDLRSQLKFFNDLFRSDFRQKLDMIYQEMFGKKLPGNRATATETIVLGQAISDN